MCIFPLTDMPRLDTILNNQFHCGKDNRFIQLLRRGSCLRVPRSPTPKSSIFSCAPETYIKISTSFTITILISITTGDPYKLLDFASPHSSYRTSTSTSPRWQWLPDANMHPEHEDDHYRHPAEV